MEPPSQQHGRPDGIPASFFVAERFRDALAALGLTSLDAIFAFEAGHELAKPNIGRFRRRLQLEVTPAGSRHPIRLFLKRYDHPPLVSQLRNWLLHHGRRSFARMECEAADHLTAAGIGAPRTVACGEHWGLLFERRSFLMSEDIRDSQSLERKLPPCFEGPAAPVLLQARRDFVRRLAAFVRRFHDTGYRHRDLYLSHVFYSATGEFSLIDLARASKPLRQQRFQMKDLAQLYYSAPAQRFGRTDRLRFYLAYVGRRRLGPQDKEFIRKVTRKADRMSRHSRKHRVPIPFLECRMRAS